jgi:hypothetical protein
VDAGGDGIAEKKELFGTVEQSPSSLKRLSERMKFAASVEVFAGLLSAAAKISHQIRRFRNPL